MPRKRLIFMDEYLHLAHCNGCICFEFLFLRRIIENRSFIKKWKKVFVQVLPGFNDHFSQ